MTMIKLPDVGRIEGLSLSAPASADPSTHLIEVQYTGRTPPHARHSLTMPLLDALYLLNLLEAMSTRHGFEHLRRPPGQPQ